jgi:hypothetical protein
MLHLLSRLYLPTLPQSVLWSLALKATHTSLDSLPKRRLYCLLAALEIKP